ncbi:MAG: MerR family DNA-binding transcriptional regulator [Alphaproteobacteria bacterium]|nr:MerR family transcriptional regulator [Rhodobiaceae bacterium]MBO6544424.1 MerR family DNA-binding transcriptional regulator [Alphaproteobacteria bacterium]MBO6628775.1 MerR family DNA-binding transcriptional regulator [Alphaproteobacteria bacterium]
MTSPNTVSAASYKEASSKDLSDTVTFSITQLAEEFGVTTRAIRFYEDKDLLHPSRAGQTRVYRPRDRARLALIVRGKAVGFSLGEIKELIDLHDTYGDEREYLIAMEKFRAQITALEAQKREIDNQIKMLEEGCTRFSKLAKEAAAAA